MSKFDTALDEAVWEIAGHGFADTMGTTDRGKWEAIADVSPVLLMNLGTSRELIERVRTEMGELADRQVAVRIAVNGDGICTRTGYALCGTPGETTMWRQWDTDLENFHEQIESEEDRG